MTLERVMELLRMNPNAYVSDILEVIDSESAAVRHSVKCKMFPDPFDERDPVGPCTCGAVEKA